MIINGLNHGSIFSERKILYHIYTLFSEKIFETSGKFHVRFEIWQGEVQELECRYESACGKDYFTLEFNELRGVIRLLYYDYSWNTPNINSNDNLIKSPVRGKLKGNIVISSDRTIRVSFLDDYGLPMLRDEINIPQE